MKTVLAVAALSLCLAFAGHAAELRPIVPSHDAPCIGHGPTRIAYTPGKELLGCAQFLSTRRIVEPRPDQRA